MEKKKCCAGCGRNGDCMLQLILEGKFNRRRKKLDFPHREGTE